MGLSEHWNPLPSKEQPEIQRRLFHLSKLPSVKTDAISVHIFVTKWQMNLFYFVSSIRSLCFPFFDICIWRVEYN